MWKCTAGTLAPPPRWRWISQQHPVTSTEKVRNEDNWRHSWWKLKELLQDPSQFCFPVLDLSSTALNYLVPVFGSFNKYPSDDLSGVTQEAGNIPVSKTESSPPSCS